MKEFEILTEDGEFAVLKYENLSLYVFSTDREYGDKEIVMNITLDQAQEIVDNLQKMIDEHKE